MVSKYQTPLKYKQKVRCCSTTVLVLMQIDEVDDGEPLEPQQSQPRRPAVFENIEEEVLIGTPTTTPDTNIHKQHSKTICRSTIMIKIFLCQSSLFLVTVGTTLGVYFY